MSMYAMYGQISKLKPVEKQTFFEKPHEGGIDPKAKDGDYQKINSGAVKTVYKRVIKEEDSGKLVLDPGQVLYTASTYLGRRELSGEVDKAQRIHSALIERGHLEEGDESYIQTDMHLTGDKTGDKTGGVIAPAAIGSLEDFNLDPKLPWKMRFYIGFQVLRGMHNMQKSGYVTGDAKLENILVFKDERGRILIRISDFGKARPLKKDEIGLVDGNPRFTAPEGVLTREGEVFSTGLMILRILEERLNKKLTDDLTVRIPKGKGFVQRRGVEGLLIRHGRKNKKGPSGQVGYASLFLKAKAFDSLGDLDNAEREERIIQDHITLVFKDLYNGFANRLASTTLPLRNRQIAELQCRGVTNMMRLLMDMTKANPKKRPSMEEAEARYLQSVTLLFGSRRGVRI